MEKILYLGSKSQSRKMLLTQTKIPFIVADQDANETVCDWDLPLNQVVENIACFKMEHVILPEGKENELCFVLTADTLSQNQDGSIHGKPVDRADAIEMLKAARDGVMTGTAFCLERRKWHGGKWQMEERIVRYVEAYSEFIIPDSWIETYLNESPGLECAGAIAIEEYGGLFLKSIKGSYTTIVGLPLFELREALEEIGFFSNKF